MQESTADIVDERSGLRYPVPPDAVANLCDALAYEFRDPALLGLALTHRSWCAEHPGFEPNERLEFLGDAVLGVVVSAALFDRHPEASEGQLSKMRAAVVCASSLAEMAVELGIGPALLLGIGEDRSGGRDRPSILADTVEAVIGAVYVDGGDAAATRVVRRIVEDHFHTADTPDHKSRLYEEAARKSLGVIRCQFTEHGPEHDKTFRAVVHLDDEPLGEGTGRSKKQAEQAAAQQAWRRLEPYRGHRPAEEDFHG